MPRGKFKGMRRRYGRKRGGGARRAGPRRNKFATKTYAYKRWCQPVYVSNSDPENPSKIVASDNTQIKLGSTNADPSQIPGTYEVGGAFTYSLNNVIDVGDFTGLYDQYRIAGIKVKITPLYNVNTTGPNAVIPQLVVARDLDDVAVPTSDTQDLLQRAQTKVLQLNRPVQFYCKPRVLVQQSGTGADLVQFSSKTYESIFIDMAFPGVVLPTWKFFLRNIYLGNPLVNYTYNWRVDTCVYFQCKNVK